MKDSNYCEGDVVLLHCGSMFRITDLDPFQETDTTIVKALFVNDEEEKYINLSDYKKNIERNLGQDDHVVISFSAARGIHLRLNRLGRI